MATSRRDRARWLLGELATWETEGLVSVEAAGRLRARYRAEAGDPPVSLRSVFLAALGALLVGGGVILLVAHNWDELGRGARALLSLLPLLIAQVMAVWVIRRRPNSRAWDEGVSIALTAAVAAAVALVAQTYQVPGDLRGFLLTCALLVLPLLYLFRGTGVAALYLLGIGSWAVTHDDGHATVVLGYLLLLGAAALALHPRLKPTTRGSKLLSWVAVISLAQAWTQVIGALDTWNWAAAYAVLFGTLFAFGRRTPLRVAGLAGLLPCGLASSFADVWRHSGTERGEASLGLLVVYGVLLVLLGALTAATSRGFRGNRPGDALLTALPIVLIVLAILNGSVAGGLATPFAVIVNLFLTALGVLWMNQGLEHRDGKRANLGLAVLTGLVVVRFFDSDFSLLARGTAFLITGAAFLVANHWLNRRLRGATEEPI